METATSSESLTPPPRYLSSQIKHALLISELNSKTGATIFLGLILLAWGVYACVSEQLGPGMALLLIGLILTGYSINTCLGRYRRTVHLLVWGEQQEAKVQDIYRPRLKKFLDWGTFSHLNGNPRSFLGMLAKPLGFRVKARVLPKDQNETVVEVSLKALLTQDPTDPVVHLLTDPTRSGNQILATESYDWLGVNSAGEFMVKQGTEDRSDSLSQSLLKALLIVVPTYVLAACGLHFTDSANAFADGNTIPPVVGFFVVLLFTLSHGVIPVFFYSLFTIPTRALTGNNVAYSVVSGFITLHMGFWYGIPIVGLAFLTGWLSLAWVILHVIIAGKGRRRWTYLEHGSTSMALGLFMVVFAGTPFFPFGLVVVLLQSLMLTTVEWKGKGLWVTEPSSG